VERFGDRAVVVAGVTLSTLSMLWLTQLSESSGYLDILGPLVLLGIGNGAAFVPLTAAGLHGVEPRHAGAASGLVNVAQQLGGSLGLAVLVTVFGAASQNAADVPASAGRADIAGHAFVAGADAAFLASAGLLATTVLIMGLVLRRRTDGLRGSGQRA
jgi:hypothetical protein